MLWWLQQLDKDQHGGIFVRWVRHKDFDGYRGRLRSTRILWWQQGLAEDDEHGFCGLKGPECQ